MYLVKFFNRDLVLKQQIVDISNPIVYVFSLDIKIIFDLKNGKKVTCKLNIVNNLNTKYLL